MRRPLKKSVTLLQPAQPEWRVEKLVPGGAGFLHLSNGQGAFALGALPGDRIAVSQAEDHGTYLRATRWTLIEPSVDRVEPACKVQSQCGGCDWMSLAYSAQLAAKAELLRDALTRVGGFQTLPEFSIVPSAERLQYRSRIRLHVGADARLGFFAAGSRALVEIPTCLVAHGELNLALDRLRAIARAHAREIQQLTELELRVAPAGPRISLCLTPARPPLRDVARLLDALSSAFHVTVSGQSAAPEFDQRFPLPGRVELRAPASAFTQVNWEVNQRLVSSLLEGAERRAVESFCDLYCGAGNFSLPLFARGLRGVGIEASTAAIGAAQRAAAEQRLSAARFMVGDVRTVLSGLPTAPRFDLVVLDPPRSGARQVIAELLRRTPREIAYCACDPVTLARDLRALCDAGYALESVLGFDMFPQTHHFETLVWLTCRV